MSNFVFNIEGLRQLMKSPETQSVLEQAGQSVATIANGSCPGYATDPHIAPYTAVCTVYPSDKAAGLDNYLHNTLLKAVGSTGLSMKVHGR